MNSRRLQLYLLLLCGTVGWLRLEPLGAPEALKGAQQPVAQAPLPAAGVIKTQTNLVLVDAVVTDKKGNYVRDVESKDFRVYEDGKEQTITSFSLGSEPNGPQGPTQAH